MSNRTGEVSFNDILLADDWNLDRTINFMYVGEFFARKIISTTAKNQLQRIANKQTKFLLS